MPDPILGVLSSLTNTLTLAKTVLYARDESKRAEAIREIEERLISSQGVLLSVQQDKLSLMEENSRLKDEIAEMKRHTAKSKEYPLTEIATGLYVRMPKEGVKSPVNSHKLCANCFEKGVYATLRQEHYTVDGNLHWRLSCNECKELLMFSDFID